MEHLLVVSMKPGNVSGKLLSDRGVLIVNPLMVAGCSSYDAGNEWNTLYANGRRMMYPATYVDPPVTIQQFASDDGHGFIN